MDGRMAPCRSGFPPILCMVVVSAKRNFPDFVSFKLRMFSTLSASVLRAHHVTTVTVEEEILLDLRGVGWQLWRPVSPRRPVGWF